MTYLVPREGLEPSSLAAYAPEAYAYTNSATWAHLASVEGDPLSGRASAKRAVAMFYVTFF